MPEVLGSWLLRHQPHAIFRQLSLDSTESPCWQHRVDVTQSAPRAPELSSALFHAVSFSRQSGSASSRSRLSSTWSFSSTDRCAKRPRSTARRGCYARLLGVRRHAVVALPRSPQRTTRDNVRCLDLGRRPRHLALKRRARHSSGRPPRASRYGRVVRTARQARYRVDDCEPLALLNVPTRIGHEGRTPTPCSSLRHG